MEKATSGNALHEAVCHGHEAMVEVLLRYGTNPFAANGKGLTAMEQAVVLRNAGLVRRLEGIALFSGTVRVQVQGVEGGGGQLQGE